MRKLEARTALIGALVLAFVVAGRELSAFTEVNRTEAEQIRAGQGRANQSRSKAKKTPVRRQFTRNDLFNAFGDLDRNLTTLDRQMAALKAADTVPPSNATTTIRKETFRSAAIQRPWMPVARTMRVTVLNIQRDADQLRALYRTRERRLRKRPFSRLAADAAKIRRQLAVVGAARTASWEKVAQARLSKDVLSLVVHFQGVSGGYGALRCEPGEQSCCEPKRGHPESPYDSCRWVCMKRVDACRSGFLGPSIGPNFQHTGSGPH